MAGEVRLTFDPDGRPCLVPVLPSRRLKDEVTPPCLLDDEWDDDGGLLAFLDDGELGEEVDGQPMCLFDAEEGYGGGMPASLDGDVHRDDDIPPLKDVILPSPHWPLKRRFTHELSREEKGKQWAPEAVEFGSRLPMLQRAHLQPQSWRPRPQSTCPVNSAPGVPLISSVTARSVSDAPGAMKSLPETRLVSLAPGVDGTRLSTNYDSKDAAPSSRRSSLTWRSRAPLPPTHPLSSAPGVQISPPNQAWPESSTPGALPSLPVTRPASSAPGVTAYRTNGPLPHIMSSKPQSLPAGSTTLQGSHAQVNVVEQPLAVTPNKRSTMEDTRSIMANENSPPGDTVRSFILSQGDTNRLGSTNLDKGDSMMVDHSIPGQVCILSEKVGSSSVGPVLPMSSKFTHPDPITNLDANIHKNGPFISQVSAHQAEPIQAESTLIAQVAPPQVLKEAQVHGYSALEVSDHQIDPFCNPDHLPENYPLPLNFSWIFMHGCWSLVPIKYSVDVANKSMVPMDLDKHAHLVTGLDIDLESDPPQDNAIQEFVGSDEDRVSLDYPDVSESDFEDKIQRLLLTGQTEDLQQGTRRSERTKKPPLRWNEEVGFIPQPPRSSKKKGFFSTTLEAPEAKKAKLEVPVNKIRRSLDVLVSRETVQGDIPSRPSSPGDF